MPISRQDLRQVEAKTQSFKQLGLPQGSTLDQIISKINTDLNFPLKMSASFPTADSKINFSDSEITSPDGTTKVVPPIQGEIITGLSSLWVDFQTQAVSNAAHFDITWPTSNTVDYYRIIAFSLVNTGKILALFSNESATESGLPDPGGFFVASGLTIGYIVLQCTDSAGYFKTAGSTSNVIENNKIFRFDWKAGGGVVAGEPNTASNVGVGEGIFAQKVGVDLQFKSLVAGSNITLTDGLDAITISTQPGETNDAVNLGTGAGVFKQKVGADLQFKSLTASGSTLLASDPESITISTPYGEANTASNAGSVGEGVFAGKVGADLQFKSLVPAGGMTITPNVDSITLSASSGEVNTASNVGTGTGLWKQKVGVDLQFKSLTTGTYTTIENNPNYIKLNFEADYQSQLGDIKQSWLGYSDFVNSRSDGGCWVPLDGRNIFDSDLYRESVLRPGFLQKSILNAEYLKNIDSTNPSTGDRFGYSLDMYGDYLIVGATEDDGSTDAISNAGEVYIYKKDQGGVDNWGHIRTLNLPVESSNKYFGSSVAIYGDYAVVGSPRTNSNRGEIYIYKKDQGGIDNWGLYQVISAPSIRNAYFGHSVDIYGDYIIVGDPYFEKLFSGNYYPNGAAYVYKNILGSWTTIKTIDYTGSNHPNPSTSFNGYLFGWSVAISDNYVVVGAPNEDPIIGSTFEAGRAIIYNKNQGGSDNWGLSAQLDSFVDVNQGNFGWSVAISDDICLIMERGTNKTQLNKRNLSAWNYANTLNRGGSFISGITNMFKQVEIYGNYALVAGLEVAVFDLANAVPFTTIGPVKTLTGGSDGGSVYNSITAYGDYVISGKYATPGSNSGTAVVFTDVNPKNLPIEPGKYIKINK